MSFDFAFFQSMVWVGIRHLPMSLLLSVLPMLLGLAVGTLLALARFHRVPVLGRLAAIYVAVVRGCPVVVLIFLAYFLFLDGFDGVARALGLGLSARDVPLFLVAIAALAVMVSAFACEAVRSGLIAVGGGQLEAAQSVGMTGWQALRRIIAPQLVPVAIPQLGNIYIGTFKATSLAYLVSVVDVMSAAVSAASLSLRYTEAYAAVALIYWAVCALAAVLFDRVERRFTLDRASARPAL